MSTKLSICALVHICAAVYLFPTSVLNSLLHCPSSHDSITRQLQHHLEKVFGEGGKLFNLTAHAMRTAFYNQCASHQVGSLAAKMYIDHIGNSAQDYIHAVDENNRAVERALRGPSVAHPRRTVPLSPHCPFKSMDPVDNLPGPVPGDRSRNFNLERIFKFAEMVLERASGVPWPQQLQAAAAAAVTTT